MVNFKKMYNKMYNLRDDIQMKSSRNYNSIVILPSRSINSMINGTISVCNAHPVVSNTVLHSKRAFSNKSSMLKVSVNNGQSEFSIKLQNRQNDLGKNKVVKLVEKDGVYTPHVSNYIDNNSIGIGGISKRQPSSLMPVKYTESELRQVSASLLLNDKFIEPYIVGHMIYSCLERIPFDKLESKLFKALPGAQYGGIKGQLPIEKGKNDVMLEVEHYCSVSRKLLEIIIEGEINVLENRSKTLPLRGVIVKDLECSRSHRIKGRGIIFVVTNSQYTHYQPYIGVNLGIEHFYITNSRFMIYVRALLGTEIEYQYPIECLPYMMSPFIKDDGATQYFIMGYYNRIGIIIKKSWIGMIVCYVLKLCLIIRYCLLYLYNIMENAIKNRGSNPHSDDDSRYNSGDDSHSDDENHS